MTYGESLVPTCRHTHGRAAWAILRRPGGLRQAPELSSHSLNCYHLAMLYRGDFVYTEQPSDLRICHDHLLGKPGGHRFPPVAD
jgi:hypothetical protein